MAGVTEAMSKRPTLREVLEAGTLEGVELGWSDTMFQLLELIGRTVTVTTLGASARGRLDKVLALADTPEELAIFVIEPKTAFYILRSDFNYGRWENGDLVLDAAVQRIRFGGVEWMPPNA